MRQIFTIAQFLRGVILSISFLIGFYFVVHDYALALSLSFASLSFIYSLSAPIQSLRTRHVKRFVEETLRETIRPKEGFFNKMSAPNVYVSTITFSGGQSVSFKPSDVVIVVGPNNVGKTQFLLEISRALDEGKAMGPVISNVNFSPEGSVQSALAHVASAEHLSFRYGLTTLYSASSANSVSVEEFTSGWKSKGGIGWASRVFCKFFSAEDRLKLSNPPKRIHILNDKASHPLHYVQRNPELSKEINYLIESAFGVNVIPNEGAGDDIPMHVGKVPESQNPLAPDYLEALNLLPTLDRQGLGLRSFVAMVMEIITGQQSILLVDEPEAFLHPPQAKLIGKWSVTKRKKSQQIFIATHSTDFLQGVLAANYPSVKIIRLNRKDNLNPAGILHESEFRTTWKDPLLRHSNIFDGLFHDAVVVCEADSDCRFYHKMLDSLQSGKAGRPLDILFVHCNGKSRVHTAIRALRSIGVPVAAIVDFDILNDKTPFDKIVQALEGDLHALEEMRRRVDLVLRQNGSKLAKGKPRDLALQALTNERDDLSEDQVLKRVRDAIQPVKPWDQAKERGIQALPNGAIQATCQKLIDDLSAIGFFVVPIGQLESFYVKAGGHGSGWLDSVFDLDFNNDPDLRESREFISKVENYFSQ